MPTRTVLRLCALSLSLVIAMPTASAQDFDAGFAQTYLTDNVATLGIAESDLDGMTVSDQYRTTHNGVTHLYLQQRHENISVFGAQINMSIASDGTVLHVANRFITNIAKSIKTDARSLDAAGAVHSAARHHGMDVTEALVPEQSNARAALVVESPNKVVLSRGGISLEPIPAELVYLPMFNGDVYLAWKVGIYTDDAAHYYVTFVNAATGEILRSQDLVVQDVWDEASGGQRFLNQVSNAVKQAPMIPYAYPAIVGSSAVASDGTYRVYAAPVESPSHAGDPNTDLRQLVSGVADATASPLGWHNDGSTAYTVTRGNNVHAYTDLDADNVADAGSDPDGGAGLVFDFPLDLTMDPSTYQPAAVTNLFYWNNIIHDVIYQYGFDEASGNFQVNNLGNGGLEGDDVRAEAQDGSNVNNANFFTPIDGNRPRMQMFRWRGRRNVAVNGGPAAGNYDAGPANFGLVLDAVGITGDVELGDDGNDLGGAGSTTDACEPLVGFTAGNIAIADRGACAFVTKALNAQAAGAIGIIIANNQATGAITLGGASNAVTIPAVSVSLEDGAVLKANLPLNATLSALQTDRDSDFDNGIIVHEYGHGISIRLTGGPAENICLANFIFNGQVDGEQMGEGWSDYYALMMTGSGEDGRGIGTYAIFEPPSGDGIRPWRYSTSMAINPSTYDSIKDPGISVPHGVGTVWASMVWDLTQNLVGRYGYDPNVSSGSGGNNVAMQLVTDGLKFQPCFPGFVDGRNAILAADQAMNGGANQCLIWDSFANRGLGFSADQGFFYTRYDGTEAFDLPVSCCTFATLTDNVAALASGGTLNAGQAKALQGKIKNAAKKVNQGNPNAAIYILGAFINQVNDLESEGILSAEQAAELRDCALGIINRTQQDNPGLQTKLSDAGGQMASLELTESIPVEFALNHSYPNPFSTTTAIRVALPEASSVRLTVYDLTGHEVARLADGAFAAGYHDFTLDGKTLASGVYFYRVDAGSFVDVKRVVLVK